MTRWLRMRVVLLALLLVGCRSRTPTYHRDVAPIFAKHCRECHRKDGIAPVPSLDDYASARTYAMPIRGAVQTRRMPTWGADNTGLCGTWQGARWLTSDEISTIARWQEQGSLEGDPEPSPAMTIPSVPFRGDASVEIGGVYRPGIGPGGYRCFVADPKLDRDRLLTAIQVVSGDPRAVAHVTLFALDSAAAEAEVTALDAADERLGYSCFGSARASDSRMVASWTWPQPVLRLPAGIRLHAGRKLVVQIHYDVAHTSSSFQSATRVNLELDDAAPEAQIVKIEAGGTLAPGQKYVAIEGQRLVDKRMRVVGIAPRMHIRGSALQLNVQRGKQSICLGDFDHWHFNDHQLFRAEKPTVLEPGDQIRIQCRYVTLGRTEPMRLGQDIDEEECTAWLFATKD